MTRDEKTKEFKEKMMARLQENLDMLFTVTGAPEIPGISLSFGPYIVKNFALYLSKNVEKDKMANIELDSFYPGIENEFKSMVKEKIEWRSNLLVNYETRKVEEVEFIPMAFKGSFLLEVIEESKNPPWDAHMMVYFAVMRTGKILHDVISNKGYKSTYPREVESKEDEISYFQELEETDLYVEIRPIDKSQFTSFDNELVETLSESDLERKIGFELIKEGIPFVVQYEIRADFPEQKSEEIIATPEFIIIDPTAPIAIYCDSRKYHERKSDQVFKDRRIDRKLQKKGFVVFRFSEKEINNNLLACIEEIKSQYLGGPYALKLPEVYEKRLRKIDIDKVSEWEKRFITVLLNKISNDVTISLKEESIIHTLLKKHKV
jgi:hypothetical protein